jgi:hypothetical protein
MIQLINTVLARQNEIKTMTMNYQNLCKDTSHTQEEYLAKRMELDNFLNTFTDNEIKVIQSIMGLGRDAYTKNDYSKKTTKLEVINSYFDTFLFKLDKNIERDINIEYMISKGLLIGEYFKLGFKEMGKLI